MLSVFSLNEVDAFKGCTNPKMNDLCFSKVVDRCYTCTYTEKNVGKYLRPPVCVPVFHNNLGVLEHYPTNNWNCTIYRPVEQENNKGIDEDDGDMNEKDYEQYIEEEVTEDINERVEGENKMIGDICKIDNFISELCLRGDKNGFCLIANFIHDICKHSNYNRRLSLLKDDFGHKFETLGCGKEKFKCLLKKSCRHLVKELDKCDEDFTCILTLLTNPDVLSNTVFLDVVQCMVPSLKQSS
jgi:hypothetical protein